MAFGHSLSKITGPLSHVPTWFFIIGYPLFWLQLFTHTAGRGVTWPLAWGLWAAVAITALAARPKRQDAFPLADRGLWFAGFGLAGVVLILVFIAGLKPIHLLQESDCLQYHYTLPRQHLILGSFAHIPWAADDLFLLPMDFALGPFWFVSPWLNKIPQLIILFGLIGIAMRLTRRLAGEDRPWAGPFVVLVILGTHGLGIQMGTGMLDLGIAYLGLAAVDSLSEGHWFLAGVEGTFFFWSKPLMPLMIPVAAGILAAFLILARRCHWQMADIFIFKNLRQALGLFLVLSVLVAGPFIAKSIYYAGTPLFPLAPGIMGGAQLKKNPPSWQSLNQASHLWMRQARRSYGHGRGMLAFLKHWWLLSVPEKGVNNAFDYPLGLTYLLMIGPFIFFLIRDLFQRRFSPPGILAVIMWGLWWFSMQQSRFLYLPLLIIFIVTIVRLKRIPRSLLLCVLISLLFEAVSLWGAHRADINRWGAAVLRSRDRQLMVLSRHKNPQAYVDWPSHDVAYAQFPVRVTRENLPHTIRF